MFWFLWRAGCMPRGCGYRVQYKYGCGRLWKINIYHLIAANIYIYMQLTLNSQSPRICIYVPCANKISLREERLIGYGNKVTVRYLTSTGASVSKLQHILYYAWRRCVVLRAAAEGLGGGRGEKEEGNVQEVGWRPTRYGGWDNNTYIPLEREHENFV